MANPEPRDEATSERFRRQRRTGTGPEMALRRELHRRGLRYRVDRSPTKGMRSRADLVFGRARVAVFVDGCFWHSCPIHATSPKNNSKWWRDKLQANVERDRRVDTQLAGAGWRVVRVWEHEDPVEAANRVEEMVRERLESPDGDT